MVIGGAEAKLHKKEAGGAGMATETKRAESEAKAQLQGIVEMVRALEEARDAEEFGHYEGEEVTMDDMVKRIQESPLSLQVRSGWHTPGEQAGTEEFELLLCTGGPAVRIVGALGSFGEPDEAHIEYQDWFTPWAELDTTLEEDEAILAYCGQFYFGS